MDRSVRLKHAGNAICDDAGRTKTTTENFFSTGGSTADQSVTLQTAYTLDGQVATLTALNTSTSSQVTQYAYGMGTADSGVARSDLLKGVIYPASSSSFSMSGSATSDGFAVSGVPTFTAPISSPTPTINLASGP